jgi:hypothetical protein
MKHHRIFYNVFYKRKVLSFLSNIEKNFLCKGLYKIVVKFLWKKSLNFYYLRENERNNYLTIGNGIVIQ